MYPTNLTACICSQLAIPVRGPFCSLVLPCTVNNLHPAFCNIKAYSIDLSILSKTRTLHVMGIVTAWDIAVTETIKVVFKNITGISVTHEIFEQLPIFCSNDQSSCRKAPYLPRFAMDWGHPRLMSIASQSFSTNLAAAAIISGSFPQNYY